MTTDDTSGVDPATAERLAKLRARRAAASTAAPADDPAPATSTHSTTHSTARRRSPAAGAKIVTAGAAATATLGLIALYGAAERQADAAGEPDAATQQALPAVDPAVFGSADEVPAASAATPAAPQIVVIVVDAGGGTATVEHAPAGSTIDDVIAQAAHDAAAPAASADPVTPSTTLAELVPVPVPQTVDLAVPAPPRPTGSSGNSGNTGGSATVAAPSPAPAPATSSGS